MRHSELIKKIGADAAKFVITGLAVGLGMMVIREPTSDAFVFSWNAAKLFYAFVGALAAALMVACIRWRMWSRADPDALR